VGCFLPDFDIRTFPGPLFRIWELDFGVFLNSGRSAAW
jgi:hypothetical protein